MNLHYLSRPNALSRVAVAAVLAASVTACGGSGEDRASVKPEESMYGLLQALAEDDRERACGFIVVEVDEIRYPGDHEKVSKEACEARLLDMFEYDIEEDGDFGSEVWKKRAEMPLDGYTAEPQGDGPDEWNISNGGDGESYYFEEFQRLDSSVVSLADDESWYLD